MSLNNRVLRSYRDILKISKQVFKDDKPTVLAARNQIRSEFIRLKDEKDTEKIDQALKYCSEVGQTLIKNVVQATPIDPRSDPNAFKINFTEETEINDNETIRLKLKAKNRQLQNGEPVRKCGSQ